MNKNRFISLIIQVFLVLNLGTSAQLCFLSTVDRAISAPLFTVPFFGESGKTKIVVAASMNGVFIPEEVEIVGISKSSFRKKIVEWASQLISSTNDLKIDYEKLNDILSEPGKCSLSTVDIKPVFIPERSNNGLSCISGINSSTTVEEACLMLFSFKLAAFFQ
ncbi:unnamed protein product [Onchocerca flexuosa]|uniref:Uncharacterized protein n=1 Tax=Onchocerca flexuosa TaxID=387005 RepID=A0A3P7ZHL5_9BILA|nr:unnamed protein product [Onchocerca flexuosa]